MWNGYGSPTYPYGYGYARRYISVQYSYFLLPFDPADYTPPYDVPFDPFNDYPLPFSLTTVKQYLKIDPENTADDNLITGIMIAAVQFAEKYTKRDFIIKNYMTYRDDFSDGFFVLRKSKFQELISFEYKVDDVFIDVPPVYYTTDQVDYSGIFLKGGTSDAWPNNITCRLQSIKIKFKAGYGYLENDIPYELKIGIFQHILNMYENRGDCGGSSGAVNCSGALPAQSKIIYDQYRIKDLYTIPY